MGTPIERELFGMLWFVLMLRVLLDVRMAMGCGYPLHLVILAQKEGGRFGLEGSCWVRLLSMQGVDDEPFHPWPQP